MDNWSLFWSKARNAAAAVLIMVGILAAASEGSILVNAIGLVVMTAGFWLGSRIFER